MSAVKETPNRTKQTIQKINWKYKITNENSK